MNQMLIILISYFSFAVTDIGEKTENKRVEKSLSRTELAKASVKNHKSFIHYIHKGVTR
jgi:hypothetical protein